MPVQNFIYRGQRLYCHYMVPVTKVSLLFLCLVVVGCRPPEDSFPGIELTWETDPDPPVAGMAAITFMLTDSTGQSLTGAEIDLEGNMTHPGMQPVLAHAEEVAPGRYSASFEFTMGGDWFILVESTLSDGRVVRRQIDIPGVRSQ